MKRRCVVCDALEDEVTLHRFPSDPSVAENWRIALKLDISCQLLQTHYGVCDLHFCTADFQDTSNTILKSTAIPTLKIEAPTKENIALQHLHIPALSMQYSTASTGGNTDISIIQVNDSHYGEEDDDDTDEVETRKCGKYCPQQHTIDAADFTVVSCDFEESVGLHVHTIKPASRSGHSGTDSDIEVINDTEWSAAIENLENNVLERRRQSPSIECSIEAIRAQCLDSETSSNTDNPQESTDHDCSVEEFSRQSSFEDTGMNRQQLVDIICSQRERIRELESTLLRYHNAHHAFFDQVEKLRLEFGAYASLDLDKTHTMLG